jgi:hypothetical protein
MKEGGLGVSEDRMPGQGQEWPPPEQSRCVSTVSLGFCGLLQDRMALSLWICHAFRVGLGDKSVCAYVHCAVSDCVSCA